MSGAAAAAREFTGSLSSVSNTAREVQEELLQHQQQRRYRVIKPFMGSPPEVCNDDDDGDLQSIADSSEPTPAPQAVKKKRSLPGTPDPSAEVIALSPKTLMATNRFVCEICHKGFQRDQNLQLHRRGHNLPWKLRQRGGNNGPADGGGARKRVYVCPEASCVHHNPARALGDLTGIKKHYCRKHGEKKWKCERCAKRYAVHSDWKAHAKVCGTREYKCDCGTLFSRRDSFVTHRAFCDALAQENNKLPQPMNMATVASALQGQHQQAAHLLCAQADDDFGGLDTKSPRIRLLPVSGDANHHQLLPPPPPLGMAGCMLSSLGARSVASSSPAFPFSSRMGLDGPPADPSVGFPSAGSASMSATALLQKAAEMGATTSVYGSAGFASVGFGSMLGGPDRVPPMSPFGPVPLPGLTQQLVGFDVGGLLPGQLYTGGSMTRAIGSLLHGGPLVDHRRPEDDDKRVVDYMGVDDQSFSGGVGHFGPHMGPWT
ncbi:hypothetical protein PR202_ga08382 [Eleusine coracana subsp. coracana]|uniref:Protein EARLY HEADING DATE 2 n=1 Tax=Eleusine coracana subsp. coracana TaxID=191504 RepID=A0AAV5C340_ELECO|nr:hypothetical protein QOZ80_1AG0045750 [Eleusine coracana subsp. coracana]GJM91959.1 hypothetical protein PR202_ga08382 [Eleusine coracana subsp. coracana]